MAASGLAALGELIFQQLAQLERILTTLDIDNESEQLTVATHTSQIQAPVSADLPDVDASVTLTVLRALQRQLDRVLFIHLTDHAITPNLSLDQVITHLMDAVWQRAQFGFAVLVLGDSELGPYHYQDMRGVAESRRHIGQPCPLPLWGELAHALVRRLDPAEADYLVIDDIAATGRPMPEEFPWMSHTGSLIILPLRKDSVAIGALLLGQNRPGFFADAEFCLELVEFVLCTARAIVNAQVQQELSERAEQLAGLQLFTRSVATPATLQGLLTTVIDGISELMGAASVLFAFQRSRINPQLQQLLAETPGLRIYQDLNCIGIVSIDEPRAIFSSLYRLFTWTIEAGQPLFFDPAQRIELPEDLYYNEAGRALIVPVNIGEVTIGALYIEASAGEHGYDEGDMIVLRTATNAAAIAFDRIR